MYIIQHCPDDDFQQLLNVAHYVQLIVHDTHDIRNDLTDLYQRSERSHTQLSLVKVLSCVSKLGLIISWKPLRIAINYGKFGRRRCQAYGGRACG